jgi:hypothetical protein
VTPNAKLSGNPVPEPERTRRRRERMTQGRDACSAFQLNQNNHSRFSFPSPLGSLTFCKRRALANAQGLSAAALCSAACHVTFQGQFEVSLKTRTMFFQTAQSKAPQYILFRQKYNNSRNFSVRQYAHWHGSSDNH